MLVGAGGQESPLVVVLGGALVVVGQGPTMVVVVGP